VKVVVVKKIQHRYASRKTHGPAFGSIKIQNKEIDGKAKYKWKVKRRHKCLAAAVPARGIFNHIVVEFGRRIYTIVCFVVTGILVGTNDKLG
jgi:hypothetical protein